MRLKTSISADAVLDQKRADHYGAHFAHDFVTDQHMYDQIHELFTTAPYEYSHSLGRSNEPYNSYPARSESSEEQKALLEIMHNHFQRGFGHLFESFKLDRPASCYLLRYNEHTPEDSDLHVTRDADNTDTPMINVVYSINSAVSSLENKSSVNTGVLAVSKYKGGQYPNNTTRDVAYFPIPHNSIYYIVGSHIHHGVAKTFCNRYVIVLSYRSEDSSANVITKLKRPALPVDVHQCKQCFNYYLSQDVLRTHVQTHISNDNRRDRQRAEKARLYVEKENIEGVDHHLHNNNDGTLDSNANYAHDEDGNNVISDSLYGSSNSNNMGLITGDAMAPIDNNNNDTMSTAVAIVDADNSDSDDSALVKVAKKDKLARKRKLGKISEEA